MGIQGYSTVPALEIDTKVLDCTVCIWMCSVYFCNGICMVLLVCWCEGGVGTCNAFLLLLFIMIKLNLEF